MSDLPADWWDGKDVATFLGVAYSTVRAYVARKEMPPADRRIGNVGVWRPETIREWNKTRPGRGNYPRSSTEEAPPDEP